MPAKFPVSDFLRLFDFTFCGMYFPMCYLFVFLLLILSVSSYDPTNPDDRARASKEYEEKNKVLPNPMVVTMSEMDNLLSSGNKNVFAFFKGKDTMKEFDLLFKIFEFEPSCVVTSVEDMELAEKYLVNEFPSVRFFPKVIKISKSKNETTPQIYESHQFKDIQLAVDLINQECDTERLLTGQLKTTAGVIKEFDLILKLIFEIPLKEKEAREATVKKGLFLYNKLKHEIATGKRKESPYFKKAADYYASVFARMSKEGVSFIARESNKINQIIASNNKINEGKFQNVSNHIFIAA